MDFRSELEQYLLECNTSRSLLRVGEVVVLPDIGNGATVRSHVVVLGSEVPVISEDVLEEDLTDRANVGVANAGLEWSEEVVGQVLLRWVVVVAVTSGLEVVHSVVLAGGDDLLAVHGGQF
jgi:hypothetical protein